MFLPTFGSAGQTRQERFDLLYASPADSNRKFGRLNGMENRKMAQKYSKAASNKVEKAMHERKRGTLRSGSTGTKVTSKKQAIAIGLSEARRAGKKVPRKKSA
jgi:uncharacterized protein DUF6496